MKLEVVSGAVKNWRMRILMGWVPSALVAGSQLGAKVATTRLIRWVNLIVILVLPRLASETVKRRSALPLEAVDDAKSG
jgi:hypothetical protein